MASKVIASHEYRNGRFGMNTAYISRVASAGGLSAGYRVGDGSYDPFFYASPVIAKAQYRKLLERVAG